MSIIAFTRTWIPMAKPLLAAVITAAAASAMAADQIFLRLDGIRGSSNDVRHKDEIDITSYSQGFRNSASVASGGGGAAVGRVMCEDITMTKNIDRSSLDLLQYVTTGRHIRSGVITFRKAGAQQVEYYVVQLSDVLVGAVERVNSAGGFLTERISLKAGRFQSSYRPQNPDGSLSPAVTFGWDCLANKGF